jgi:hypothetical protein
MASPTPVVAEQADEFLQQHPQAARFWDGTGSHLLEDWQRYSYPMFCDRMASRLGESTCRTATRIRTGPAEGRVTAYAHAARSGGPSSRPIVPAIHRSGQRPAEHLLRRHASR